MSKPVQFFTAEDFAVFVPSTDRGELPSFKPNAKVREGLAGIANAKLAPLAEAIEEMYYAYWVLDRPIEEYVQKLTDTYRALKSGGSGE